MLQFLQKVTAELWNATTSDFDHQPTESKTFWIESSLEHDRGKEEVWLSCQFFFTHSSKVS